MKTLPDFPDLRIAINTDILMRVFYGGMENSETFYKENGVTEKKKLHKQHPFPICVPKGFFFLACICSLNLIY